MAIPTMKELLEKRGALAQRAKALGEAAKDRVLTPEERSQFAELDKEVGDLDASMADAQTRARLEAIAKYQNVDRPPGQSGDADSRSADDPFNRLHEYSLFKAIRSFMPGEAPLSGLEAEVHSELQARMKAIGVTTRGLRIPHSLPMGMGAEKRVTDTTAGAGALKTVVSDSFIDVLRARLVLRQAGGRVIPGLVGSFKMPKKTSTAAGAWVGESTAATPANQAWSAVTFAPKNVCAGTVISRDLLHQTSLDMEMIARDDLLQALATAIDKAGFHGTGSANQPQGIAANSSCPTVAIGTHGGAMTWEKLIELQTTVFGANADALRYVTSPVGWGHLLTTVKVSGQPTYLAENGLAGGLPVLRSTQISKTLTKGDAVGTCTALFCGDFSDCMVGLWGSIDLIVDPLTSKPDVAIDAYQTADIEFRHPEAITKCLDIVF